MAKKQKFKTKLTSIARLSKYTAPFKMVGDPPWTGYGKMAWSNRERAVYAYEMERKNEKYDNFTTETYRLAHRENKQFDYWVSVKWDQYDMAWQDNIWEVDYPDACREYAAWKYENEYCVDIAC